MWQPEVPALKVNVAKSKAWSKNIGSVVGVTSTSMEFFFFSENRSHLITLARVNVALFEAPVPLREWLYGDIPPAHWPVPCNPKPPAIGWVGVWSPKKSRYALTSAAAEPLFNVIPSQFARKNAWLMEKELVLKVEESTVNLSKKVLIPKSLWNSYLYPWHCVLCIENVKACGIDTYPTRVYSQLNIFLSWISKVILGR